MCFFLVSNYLDKKFDPKINNGAHNAKIECSFLGGFGKWRYSLKYASNQGGVNESPEP